VTIQDGKIKSKGTSYALSNFGSAEGLKSMGFSDGDISSAMNKGKDIAAKAAEKAKFAALTADAGGGGARAAASIPQDPAVDYDKLLGRNKNGKDKKEASVAGMSKKYGSDNIGVAGDNIFEMITRRYKAYDERKSFIEGEQ
jgi:hypothetical protein